MEYSSIIKRAKKIIKAAEDRKNMPTLVVIRADEDIPDSNGLIIVLYNFDLSQ